MSRITWAYGILSGVMILVAYANYMRAERNAADIRRRNIEKMTRERLAPWEGWRHFWDMRKAEEYGTSG